MNFKLERDMIPIIKDNLADVFKYNFIAEELHVNHRIVDMVISSVEVYDTALQYKNSLRKLSNIDLDVLSLFLLNNELSIQYLKQKLRMSTVTIKSLYLTKFIKMNLVIKISRYKYKATAWSNVIINNFIAIEAKLYDWRNALNQAKENLIFADSSFVALDKTICDKLFVKESFKRENIGLLSVSIDSIEIINKPTKNKYINERDMSLQKMILCRDLICSGQKWKTYFSY